MRQQRWVRFVGVAMLVGGGLVSTACAAKSINQVLADPSRYRDREVQLSGSVVDSYSVANRGAYRIDDNTGQLWVVSTRGTPRKGARVVVKGTVREAFNLGSLGDQIKIPGLDTGVVLMESSHKVR